MTVHEDQLVAWFANQAHLPEERYPLGIGDDMAEIACNDLSSICITTDMLLEGTHFDLQQASLEQVGYKAMAVSLSDCAAMATQPLAAVVSLGLPTQYGEDEIKTLHRGLLRAGQAFGCGLVGGDLTCWPTTSGLVVNVTMLSHPGNTAPVTRAGGQPGDVLCVTGTLGGSLDGHHLDFIPRVQEALALTQIVPVHAMMDLSDGLSTDLQRLCKSSGVGACITASQIPLSPAANANRNPIHAALEDGEDFELLFALSLSDQKSLQDQWSLQTPITSIGHLTAEPELWLLDHRGKRTPLLPRGFDHFNTLHRKTTP